VTHTITLIPGDGIGPEVTDAVTGILEASGVSIDWERHLDILERAVLDVARSHEQVAAEAATA